MQFRISKIAKDSILYLFGGVLIKSFSLILIPLYTRVLSVEEYGLLSLLNVFVNILAIFFALGISNASLRYSFNNEQGFTREEVYGNSIILQLISWPIMMIIILPSINILAKKFYPNISFFPLIFVLVLGVSFLPFRHIWESLIRAQKKSNLFVVWAIILFFSQTSLIIFFVAYLKMNIVGIFLAQLIVNFVFGIIAIIYLRNYSKFTFSRSLSKKILLFGIPLIPYFIFVWIETASIRILLEKFIGLYNLGILAVSMQFAGILQIVTSHLDNALLPNFYEISTKNNAESIIGNFQLKYFYFVTAFAIGLYLLEINFFPYIVDKKYYKASIYIPWLLFIYWIKDLTKIFKWNLLAKNRSKNISTIQLISTILTIVFIVIFLSLINELKGLVIALLINSIIQFLLYFINSQKARKINLYTSKILTILIFYLAIIILIMVNNLLENQIISFTLNFFIFFLLSYYLWNWLNITSQKKELYGFNVE